MVIGQEKIYLIENKGDEIEFNSGKGFDIPIHRYTDYCTTQEEEEQKARQIIREELQIENPIYATYHRLSPKILGEESDIMYYLSRTRIKIS